MTDESAYHHRAEQFVTLHAKNHHRVSAFVHMLVPNWQDAEEIVQDTFMILWKKIDEFDPATEFFSWAARVAQYEVLNYRSRKQRAMQMMDPSMIEALAATVIEIKDDTSERQEALAKCVQELPTKERQILSLRYREGGSISVVSETFGLTTAHMHRQLRKIRERLLRCVRLRIATQYR
jgi:RNA polymerase sigma-70 factor (ECF subfamily)